MDVNVLPSINSVFILLYFYFTSIYVKVSHIRTIGRNNGLNVVSLSAV